MTDIFKEKLLDYIKINNIDIKIQGSLDLVTCPYCNEQHSGVYNKELYFVLCKKCKKSFNIYQLYNKLNNTTLNDYEIQRKIKDDLKIEMLLPEEKKEIEQYLNFFHKSGWSLIPVNSTPNPNKKDAQKVPLEPNWTQTTHKDINEWYKWVLDLKQNLGVRTGEISGITVVDIDTLDDSKIPEEIRNNLGNTLVQRTNKGLHYFYQYEPTLNTRNKINTLPIDIANDGHFILIYPSVCLDVKRSFDNLAPIQRMPDKLKEYLLQFSKKTYERDDVSCEFKKPLLKEGDGRNDFFIRLGGRIRQFLSPKQTTAVLKLLDKIICYEPLGEELEKTVLSSIEGYIDYDEVKMEKAILDYLQSSGGANKRDIEMVVIENFAKGENKKKVDKCIQTLLEQKKIVKKGKEFAITKDIIWKDFDLACLGTPINFKMPYFDEFAFFNTEDLIIIGAPAGFGKTHLAINIIKKLLEQGITPYYISTEAGSRYAKISVELGISLGAYKVIDEEVSEFSLDDFSLQKNAITIFDWVEVEDFAKTNLIIKKLGDELKKKKGVLICFVQLKTQYNAKGEASYIFYAEGLLKHYPALVVKYITSPSGDSYFEFSKIRDRKVFIDYNTKIPVKYDSLTKRVELVEDKADDTEEEKRV